MLFLCSGLSMQKDERAKQDALIRLESQLTKSAVKKPSANGGFGLLNNLWLSTYISWVGFIAFLQS